MKKWLCIGFGFGVGVALTLVLIAEGWAWYENRPRPWKKDAIVASFTDAQATADDRHIFLSYALVNKTDNDITLSDGDVISSVNLLRQKSTYQQDDQIKLDFPIFIPANHSVIAVVNLPGYKASRRCR